VWARIAYSVSYLGLDGPGSHLGRGKRFSLLYKSSRPSPGSTQPPIQWLPSLYPGIKAAGSYVDHFPLSSVEVKEWSWTSDPAVLLHGVDRNDFTLFLQEAHISIRFVLNTTKERVCYGTELCSCVPHVFPQLLGPQSWFPNCSLFSRSKVVPVHVVRAYCRNRGTAPFILDLGTRWRWVVGFTPGKKAALKALQAATTTSPLAHWHTTFYNTKPTYKY